MIRFKIELFYSMYSFIDSCIFSFNPIGSMYDIFTYIYHKNQPNVGTYTSPMDPMGIE